MAESTVDATIVVVADPAAASLEAGRTDRRGARRRRGRARAGGLGDDRRLERRRHLPGADGDGPDGADAVAPTCTCGGATSATCRATIRSPTPSRSTTSSRASAWARKARPGAAGRASPCRSTRSTHFEPARRSRRAGVRSGPPRRWPMNSARSGPRRRTRAGRSSTSCSLGVGADGHILSVFPGSPALGAADLAMAIPAPTHIEPHVERVTLNPAVVGAARQVVIVATGAGQGTGPRRDLRPDPRSEPVAGAARAARGRDMDPRRGRGREPAAASLIAA